MGESYYEVLGVAPDASTEEIERAYRERVLETHPDRNDDPDAADLFRAVTTAADVLTDEAERARYDRLGHAAFCGDGSGPQWGGEGPRSNRDTNGPDEEWWEQYSSNGNSGDPTRQSGPSHHARQRARRRRSNADTGWFGAERDDRRSAADAGTTENRSPSGSQSTSRRRDTDAGPGRTDRSPSEFDRGSRSNAGESRRGPTGPQDGDDAEFGGFAVHQWDDDVELASPFRALDSQTLVFACGLALLYPILVYATITPHAPLLVNVVVGSCTLVLIGYLLTLPRIALASFGGWSVLATIALAIDGSIVPTSIVGLGMLAGFWIPFGYAVGVWFALRP